MAEKVEAENLTAILGLVKKTVTVEDNPVTVSPFRLKQLSQVLKCLSELSEAGVNIEPYATNDDPANPQIGLKKDFNWIKAGLNAGQPFIEILAIATGQTIEWAENLLPTDAIAVAMAVWEV